MDFALPPAFERFPRHRAKAEEACRTGLADPDVVGMAVTGSFATGHRHGEDLATEGRAVTLRALEAGLDWTPGSA
jgi:hypothetical protein